MWVAGFGRPVNARGAVGTNSAFLDENTIVSSCLSKRAGAATVPEIEMPPKKNM